MGVGELIRRLRRGVPRERPARARDPGREPSRRSGSTPDASGDPHRDPAFPPRRARRHRDPGRAFVSPMPGSPAILGCMDGTRFLRMSGQRVRPTVADGFARREGRRADGRCRSGSSARSSGRRRGRAAGVLGVIWFWLRPRPRVLRPDPPRRPARAGLRPAVPTPLRIRGHRLAVAAAALGLYTEWQLPAVQATIPASPTSSRT